MLISLFLQGLRNGLCKSGVRVMMMKPGFVDTKMTFGSESGASSNCCNQSFGEQTKCGLYSLVLVLDYVDNSFNS
ncbi:MAG: hypothetical protein ACFB2X_28035 [Rivularia sp. (in: cyanobacteria)]